MREAYFICNSNKPGQVLKEKWDMVKAADFEKMVKDNMVQFLVWKNGAIKCEYTEEEVKAFKLNKVGKEFLKESIDNYWNMDVSFKMRHVNAATNNAAIAASVAGIQKTFGAYTVAMYMYGNINAMEGMVQDFGDIINRPIKGSLKTNGVNIGMFMFPFVYFDNGMDIAARNYKLMLDTSTTKYILKGNMMPKVPLIGGNIDSDEALRIVNKLDKLTLDNEKALGM